MTTHHRQTHTTLALLAPIITAFIITTSAAAHPAHRKDRPYDPSAYVYGGASAAVATAIQALGYRQA
jgi:hypothetical protein